MTGWEDRRRARRDEQGSVEGPRERRDAVKTSVEGTIREALPNAMYAVELENGQRILTHMSGTVRNRIVRVIPGDRVTVEVSPYDPLRGRITQRHR